MRHLWLPAIFLAGAIGALAAGTEDTQRLVTLTPPSAQKQSPIVQSPEPSAMPTVVVTPPSGPAKPRKPTGPSAKAYANVLTDLRKPKPVGRPTAAQTAAIALTPPQPAPRSAPSQADPGQPIMLLPPPQAASSANLSSRDAWLQRRAIALDLTTARQLLMAGQSPDARHILDNAQTHIRLFPVDRISQQVAVAIRALDGGDRVQALQAIDRAIDAAS